MQPVIQLKDVRKEFRFWDERPNSLKTLLVDALKGKLKWNQKKMFTVLDGVSFDVYPGEFVGVMGRNGAGKSTLLKLMCGIYQPTYGTVSVTKTIAPLIELGAGFHGDLSGYENIFLNASILGFGRNVTMKAVDAIIEFSELGEKIHMPVKNYSSGMMVRLGFSIAVHLDAPILLVDEVLAVGDAGFQSKCLNRIRELHEQGRTIILVTHAAEAVAAHCQRCIVIDQHKKVYDGPAGAGAEAYLKAVLT